MKKDIVIIGAGAAGLICAYKIAKYTKLSVLLMEKESYPGKKLKAAGSGKCNITNKNYGSKWYHSNEESILENFFMEYSYTDILDLFDELGIPYYEQNGYYYPLSNQGKQVVALLKQRCLDVGVEFSFNSLVTAVTGESYHYTISYCNEQENGHVHCKGVIFATGGKAAPGLGGSETGYHLLKSLGIAVTDIFPALCPIYINDPLLKVAKGVRVNGTISIKNKSGKFFRDDGQIQFNQDSISGICVMNGSSFFYPWMKDNQIEGIFLNLLPDYSWDEVKNFLLHHKALFGEESILNCLDALMPEALALYVLARCKCENEMQMSKLKEKQINKIASMLKKMDLNYVNQLDYEKAQVTSGGVSLSEIDIHSFECKKYKGMYILGELLDVNGNCGGYNITFAMLSAMVAAKDIREKMRNTYD